MPPAATPTSVRGPEVKEALARARRSAFPSPEDWRDVWIYFLLVDRFNNPQAAPQRPDPCLPYQGGSFEGVRQQLDYLKELGAGAIWLSPVLMNPQAFTDYYGGYATQDFLRVEPRFCKDPQAARRDPKRADRELRSLIDAIHGKGMYVILDIVLNHAGDLFNYEGMRDAAPWKGGGPEYQVFWRDGTGLPHGDWTDVSAVANLPREAGVWPKELQTNLFFRRRGDVEGSPDRTRGDFGRLKELVTDFVGEEGRFPVRELLIQAYQYLIARFDLDGFRVDTLMYVERDFARVFANAMREFALSIGKKNFYTFGEVWMDDDETKIAEYVGRDTTRDPAGIIGFDAALDFPVRRRLEGVCKGTLAPKALADHMDYRLTVQRTLLSSHGDAGAYFVTFLENHDLPYRYAAGCQPSQVTLALTCLYALQGIPCLYYGMEQGMATAGDNREAARYCLWRDPQVFSRNPQHSLYRVIRELSRVRRESPALRYGRQYFRPLTGNGIDFGYSEYQGGVLAFSRLLNDTEVLVVANASQTQPVQVGVVVDRHLRPRGKVLFSNLQAEGKSAATAPGPLALQSGRAVLPVSLRPMEALILA